MSAVLPDAPASGRWRVQAFPAFRTHAALADFLARASWHLAHVPDLALFVPLAPGVSVPKHLALPEGMDPRVQQALDDFLPKVKFQLEKTPAGAASLLVHADVVLKWQEGDHVTDRALRASDKFQYKVDPAAIRQEGSYFIQCAFDLHGGKEAAIAGCERKFAELAGRLGRHSRAWVLATGPSVEAFAEHDYSDAIVIACNSVVLNDELMRTCRPSILVFADPIFHFGVSGYAGRFREVIEQRLRDSDITIVVPFKYYPLMAAKFPRWADRIVGVPFTKSAYFNFDVRADFRVRTTANILTLLLLPLATTFAPEVHITGCDGRPLDQDDYFWGHGASVQLNDKMANIRAVHPGFFDIDYNEYYFEHCHTLSNLLREGEDAGWRFAHHGPSWIPALRDRPPSSLALPVEAARAAADAATAAAAAARADGARACVVIEQDGIGSDGHYVRWHRNLVSALQDRFEQVDVLCNRQQDPTLYACPARPTFTSFSWSVSRSELCYRSDFATREFFTQYVQELLEGIRATHSPLPPTLSLYVYYGSVQILKAIQLVRGELLEQGCNLRAFVCLFHESVIVGADRTEPRFPPGAAGILAHAAAQQDVYRVASVTRQLATLVYERLGVRTEAYTNPTPARDDAASAALVARMGEPRPASSGRDRLVLFPTVPRPEKGGEIVSAFIAHLAGSGVPRGHRYRFRGDAPPGLPAIRGLEFLGEHIDDDAYWANLREADVVVAPYPAPCFTYRTSGILVDALVTGTPSIVLSGTWLAETVEELGVGLVVDYLSPRTIASAVTVVLANDRELRDGMAASAARYLRQNDWKTTAAFAVQ